MVSSQEQAPQRAHGDTATMGRLFLLDLSGDRIVWRSRQDFLKIVRAERNNLPSVCLKLKYTKGKEGK